MGIRLADGSTARLEQNVISDGKDSGVALCAGACSALVDNTIKGHSKANVLIYGGATRPTLLRNVIEGSAQAGVYMYAGAGGCFEDCEIRGNVGPNMLITEGCDPTIHKCTIHSSDDAGVLVHLEGKGSLTESNLYNNRTYGVVVLTGGATVVTKNWLHGRRQGGMLVDEGGRPKVFDNDIEGNSKAGITLRGACSPHVHHNRIYDGRDSGIHAMEGGGGIVEDNEIYRNERAGIGVETGAAPLIRRNRIYDGLESGAFFFDGGMGTFEENEVWGNTDAGVQIIEAADPLVIRNKLRKQRLPEGASYQFLMPNERRQDDSVVAQSTSKTKQEAGDVRHKEVAPLWIHAGGFGQIRDNDIYESDWHGVAIGAQAQPTLEGNRIYSNRRQGVFMQDGAAPATRERHLQELGGRRGDRALRSHAARQQDSSPAYGRRLVPQGGARAVRGQRDLRQRQGRRPHLGARRPHVPGQQAALGQGMRSAHLRGRKGPLR